MENSNVFLFAVFNDKHEITEEMFEEVQNFATYIFQREKRD